MQPAAWPEPDPVVAAAIAAKYRGKRQRPLAVLVRDRLGQWLADEEFADAFGVRGRPGWSPSRLALVTILQRAENLGDRQAAEAARTRIDWQYLLGLPLDDPGFDHTVLPEFRAKVADAGLEQVALDALLERLAAEGLVKAGGRQRADSTHVTAAVAALGRLTVGESVRAALEALAATHPDWLEQRICVPDFARRYGTPMTSWRPRPPRPGAMSWRSPTPATGTRCWRRSTTRRPRPGCASPGSGRAAPGAAAELHPHDHLRRAGGDQAAGEGA